MVSPLSPLYQVELRVDADGVKGDLHHGCIDLGRWCQSTKNQDKELDLVRLRLICIVGQGVIG